MASDRFAALDIGSNSVNLLVAKQRTDGTIEPLYEGMQIPRVSEGLEATGRLATEAMQRTANAIRELLDEAEVSDDVPLQAVITAPGRRAENGEELAERLRRDPGIDVRIVSSEEEADLSRLATRRSFPELDDFIMIDVGGASTELVLCHGDNVHADVSIDIGAVRLTEAHLEATDPPSADAIERARESCRQALSSAIAPFKRESVAVVLIGGTATTLAGVHMELESYDAEVVHRSELSLDDVRAFNERVGSLTVAEKRHLPSIHPSRADVILGGSLLIQTLLEMLELDRAFVSDRGVRWGVLWRQIDQ